MAHRTYVKTKGIQSVNIRKYESDSLYEIWITLGPQVELQQVICKSSEKGKEKEKEVKRFLAGVTTVPIPIKS